MPKTNQRKAQRPNEKKMKTVGSVQRRQQQMSRVAAPVSYANTMNRPNVRPRERRFHRCERIDSIMGSVAFATTQHVINPGLETFPQLSREAAIFDQYRFHNLKFLYVHSSSTSKEGVVYITPDYNVRDAAPTDLNQAANNKDVKQGVPWESFNCSLDIPCLFPVGPRKFIRNAAITGDRNLYDACTLYVSTEGQADASKIGELWAEYDVEFFAEQSSPSDELGPSSTSQFKRGTDQALVTTVPSIIVFDAPTARLNPLNIAYSAGSLTPPAGFYRFDLLSTVSDSLAENLAVTLQCFKDGVAFEPGYDCSTTASATGLGDLCPAVSNVVACNGTNVIDFRVTATGAAGTLKILTNSLSLLVTVA
jgi:hypothetical protein